MECGWQRKESLGWQVRKVPEAEGSPIMDDRVSDGRVDWVAGIAIGRKVK